MKGIDMKLAAYFQKLREKRRLTDLLVALPLFLLSLGVILYYIIGPSEGYFHSDCTDSILWANAALESGKILAEDFYYAAILPFGSFIWMVPAVALFGLSMPAQILSMSIFAVLFCAVLAFFFRSMKWGWKWTAAAVFSTVLILSGSEKLREIMWEHTIYYSLGILLVFLLLGLIFRVLDSPWEKGKRSRLVVWSALLFAVCLGCGTDSFQVLAITVVPALGALALYTFFDKETPLISWNNGRKYIIAVIVILGSLMGLAILAVITQFGKIDAYYENSYSLWSSVSSWHENAGNFFEHYFSLLGIETPAALFSFASVLTMIKLAGALLLLVCPVVLLFQYRRIRDRYTKIALLAHVLLTAVILFGYICGMLSVAAWRLTPFVGSSAVATLLCIKWLICENEIVGKRIGGLIMAVILAFSLVNVKTIVSIPADYGRDDSIYVTLEELEARGLTYGYATFWNAGRATLLSDSKVKVRNINLSASGISPNRYQSSETWYKDKEGQETYFLMLTESEYTTFKATDMYKELLAYQALLSTFRSGDYYILVLSQNLF
jgi:hypothetical protein